MNGLSAKVTGVERVFEESTYYEYTCCPAQANSTGEACGDYTEEDSWDIEYLSLIIMLIIFGASILLGLCGWAIFYFFFHPTQKRAHDKMVAQHTSSSTERHDPDISQDGVHPEVPVHPSITKMGTISITEI